MKFILLLVTCHLSLSLFSQAVVEGKWTTEYGASTNNSFNKSACFNFRYISPRFRWSDADLTEEQEKQPEKLKRTRLMFELLYGPPIKNLCMGLNLQYRILRYKIVSLEAYGGLKFFFIRGPDFAIRHPFIRGSTNGVWYINAGLLLQVNLGVIAPFADIGYDGIVTVGTEVHFSAIHLKLKKRYKLHAQEVNQ